jgi:hypothetical protein
MIQNYYILAGLIGVYSMVKTNDPVVILVVGILSMFSFSAGLSGRPELNDLEQEKLTYFCAMKVMFAFFVGIVIVPITAIFYRAHPFLVGYFLSYQIVSFIVWRYLKRYRSIKGFDEILN